MKKVAMTALVGLGLMVGATSTLSAGCGGCPTFHFGCKKKTVKHVKKVRKHHKRSCSFHIPCPSLHFRCSK